MNTVKQIISARQANTNRGLQIVVTFVDNSEVWFSAEYLTKKLVAIGATLPELIAAPGNYQFSAEFIYSAAGSTYEDKAGVTHERKSARWEASKVQAQLTAAGAVVKQMASMMAASFGLAAPVAVATPTLTSEPVTEEAEIEIDDEV